MSRQAAPGTGSLLDDEHHGPAIIVAAGIMFGTTVIALTMRLHQRWPWTKLMRREDVMLVIATVSALAL